jgi:transposase
MNKKIVAQNKQVLVGVDVHVNKHVVTCKIDGVHTGTVHLRPNHPRDWENFIGRFPGCDMKIVYEAGLTGYNLYDLLTGLNGLNMTRIDALVAPPAKIAKAPGDRVKTDKRDSKRLLDALEVGNFKPVVVPTRAQREERALVRERERIVGDIKRMKNEIHGFLKFHGIPYARIGLWSASGLEAAQAAVAQRAAKDDCLAQIMAAKIELLRLLMAQLVRFNKSVRRLFKEGDCAFVAQAIARQTGVGLLSAVTMAVETPDFLAFRNSEAYASYTGTVPSENSSGDSVSRGGITHVGNRHIRRVLTECAWAWIRRDKDAAAMFRKIRAGSEKRTKTALVAMMRRLAVRVYHLAKTALLERQAGLRLQSAAA